MKLVDLKMSSEQKKSLSAPAVEESNYPYGTLVTVSDTQVEELGLRGASCGQKVRIVGLAVITRVESSADNGAKRTSVAMQIQQMGAELEVSTEEFMRKDVFKNEE